MKIYELTAQCKFTVQHLIMQGWGTSVSFFTSTHAHICAFIPSKLACTYVHTMAFFILKCEHLML